MDSGAHSARHQQYGSALGLSGPSQLPATTLNIDELSITRLSLSENPAASAAPLMSSSLLASTRQAPLLGAASSYQRTPLTLKRKVEPSADRGRGHRSAHTQSIPSSYTLDRASSHSNINNGSSGAVSSLPYSGAHEVAMDSQLQRGGSSSSLSGAGAAAVAPFITDYAPEWDSVKGGAKMVLCLGNADTFAVAALDEASTQQHGQHMQHRHQDSMEPQAGRTGRYMPVWGVFGTVTVPAQWAAPGVLRLVVPPADKEKSVPLFITSTPPLEAALRKAHVATNGSTIPSHDSAAAVASSTPATVSTRAVPFSYRAIAVQPRDAGSADQGPSNLFSSLPLSRGASLTDSYSWSHGVNGASSIHHRDGASTAAPPASSSLASAAPDLSRRAAGFDAHGGIDPFVAMPSSGQGPDVFLQGTVHACVVVLHLAHPDKCVTYVGLWY